MTPTYPINENHAKFAGGRTSKVRKAAAEVLPGIVTIHRKAFGNFFLTQLGDRFLRAITVFSELPCGYCPGE